MQSETGELMIQFKDGVDEATARSVVATLGGSVRRRMRTDDANQVMLLAQVPAPDIQRRAQQAANHPQVARVEVNQGGYGIV